MWTVALASYLSPGTIVWQGWCIQCLLQMPKVPDTTAVAQTTAVISAHWRAGCSTMSQSHHPGMNVWAKTAKLKWSKQASISCSSVFDRIFLTSIPYHPLTCTGCCYKPYSLLISGKPVVFRGHLMLVNASFGMPVLLSCKLALILLL